MSSAETRTAVQQLDEKLLELANETHFPRAITRIALKRKEYRIGVYNQLGQKDLISELRNDLLFFQHEQDQTGSSILTFIAIFNDSSFDSEGAFDMALWQHLSLLVGEKNFNPQTEDAELRFNFDGLSFAVAGMHPMSSKPTRRFSKPALIFNLQEQIEQETPVLHRDTKNLFKNESKFNGVLR